MTGIGTLNVMRVLRENKDSVMAVLEAFVYDPLLNWRLIDGKNLMNKDCRILILLIQSLRSSPRLERVGGRAVEYKILVVSVFLYYMLLINFICAILFLFFST